MDTYLKINILIIEDNPGDQILLHENLISTNLILGDIVMVEALADGVAKLKEQNFELIFLDLFLPDSSGLDSFKELIKINLHIPVIIYSGLSDSQIALKAITLGAQDFLIKGDYSISLLEKTIRYSIERKNSSEALEESNERYNMVSKATHDMVWDWNLVTDEVYRNMEGWKKIFKTVGEKEFGKKDDWADRVHPDDRQRVQEEIDIVIQSDNQQLFESEFRVFRDDDTIGYIEDRGYVIRNGEGKAIRIIGASHDITARKYAEQNLLLSEQRFKSLVLNSSDLLAILDKEGNYKYVSPSCKRILGYDPEFFLGKSGTICVHPDDIQIPTPGQAAISTEKFVIVPPVRFKNAFGEWRWIEGSMTNMLDDPAINGIVVNSRDVTEKKIADDEIEKLSLIAKETINGVVISDKNDSIIWVNEAFTKMYGYQLDEVKGKHPRQFLHGAETNIEDINYAQKKIIQKEPFTFEIINYHKNGNKLNVKVQVQVILDEFGVIKQFFALETDITNQKQLEEKVGLEKILKQKQITNAVYSAQENERSEIGRELHDNVNQLLGATKLYIDMARKNEESREEMLITASGYTLNAIQEIRKLSKTLITPLIKEVGLVDSIKDLMEELMLVHPIQIILTANSFLEQGLDDKFKLNIFRIAQEQINNILKHAAAKTININIEDDFDKLLFSISDDGIGFDTTKRRSGVGFTNIKSRSELFNGTQHLWSQSGKGTRLSITFNKADILIKNPTQFKI